MNLLLAVLGKREQGGAAPSEGGPTPAGGPSRECGGCPAGACKIREQ
jgi:hypothetical protein